MARMVLPAASGRLPIAIAAVAWTPLGLRQFSQADDRRIADSVDDAVENPAPAGTVHCTRG